MKAGVLADPTVIRFFEISGLVQSTEGGSDSLSWSTIFGIPVAGTFRVGRLNSEQELPRGDFKHECTGRLHGSSPESQARSRDRSVSAKVHATGPADFGGMVFEYLFRS